MDDFIEIGVDLESLSITFGNLESIKNQAFKNVHGLKYLDLSENNINQIENEAFYDVNFGFLYFRILFCFLLDQSYFVVVKTITWIVVRSKLVSTPAIKNSSKLARFGR